MKLRFKLWHLFAVVAVVAVGIWAWNNVGFVFIHHPNHDPHYTRIAIYWGGRKILTLPGDGPDGLGSYYESMEGMEDMFD